MDLLALVQEKFKNNPHRLNHILGVYERAIELQAIYGGDLEAIKTAALLHDLHKFEPIDVQLSYIKDEALKKKYTDTPVMYHGLSAAFYAKDYLNITDPIVFEAISYHIWGKIGMRLETMLLVVADFTEKNRTIEASPIVYEIAKKNLKEAYVLSLEFTSAYLSKQGIMPHEEQLAAIEHYKEIV